jgi:hypothetical protein
MAGIIWTLVVLLFAFWLVGVIAHFGGSLIYIALVVAIIIAIFNLFTGRRTTGV